MSEIKRSVPLKPLTTLGIGGEAEYFTEVKSLKELEEVVSFAHEQNLPVTILGGGSNVLVSDSGVKGLVIKNQIGGTSYEENKDHVLVTAGAGVIFDDLVLETIHRGLWGLENLSAIPGLVGAVPIQNVGAYGMEAGELITEVSVYDLETGQTKRLTKGECHFAYRDSFFKTQAGKRYAVTTVTFCLAKAPRPRLEYKDLSETFSGKSANDISLSAIREAVIDIRAGKFPDWHVVGTAGSFFKNPILSEEKFLLLKKDYPSLPGFGMKKGEVKVPLGWILDKVCGLRGVREGNVGTYEKQSLVLVNYGNASSIEMENFARKISDLVLSETNINIEWEVNKI